VTGSPPVVDHRLDPTGGAALRRSPAQPVDGPADVLGLHEDLSALGRVAAGVARRLEAVSGLRAGGRQALIAVSEGAAHPRAVARRTGPVAQAGAATVESLVQQGLLRRHRHAAATAGLRPAHPLGA
jgi:hypothetical protein